MAPGNSFETFAALNNQAASGVDPVAVKADGTLWDWGGSAGYGSIPVQVTGISHAIAASAGIRHTLALLQDGTVWAWGRTGTANWVMERGMTATRRSRLWG